MEGFGSAIERRSELSPCKRLTDDELAKKKDKIFSVQGRLPSFRNRVIIILLGLALGIVSILFTNGMARQLRSKESYEVEIWAMAYARSMQLPMGMSDPLQDKIMDSRNNIPLIMINEHNQVRYSNLIPYEVTNHPDLLQKKLDQLSRENNPLVVNTLYGTRYYVFYGNSRLQKTLVYFPFVQIGVIVIFVAFGFLTYRSSEQDERNKVWIGLAKETAHQLGTPISSLLGWIEYLRSQPIDPEVVVEMEKDLTRLMKVADRFSKIGSETVLTPANINETVGASVMYFRTRIPKNVTLDYNGFAMAPLKADVNAALFEWVIENLLKNSLDALQGVGSIDVNLSESGDWIYIDVRDTGKGIAKANFKRIFEPGFTTKTRGWGLGLSLSKRIVEEYHKGKIYVVDSEIGKGATIRIALKRVYD